MPLRVIFARHGESAANVACVFANRREHVYDLTAAGVAQAEALARSLEGIGITTVYTSPVRRAARTAEIVAEFLHVPLTEEDGLREYDVGDHEGLPYAGKHAWRFERYAAIEADWRCGMRDARHPGGESLAELQARVVGFMDILLARHAPSETIVALSHGGLLRVVLPLILAGLPRDHMWTHPLGYTGRILVEHDLDEWQWVYGPSTGEP